MPVSSAPPRDALPSDERFLLTLAEAAAALRIGEATERRYVAAGRLAGVRLPSGRLRVRRESIMALLGGGGVGDA